MAGDRGFTLVEVLVALVVMTTMAIMAWRGIDALSRSRDISQARLAQVERLQTVLAQWEADLRALQDSKSDVPALAFDGGSLTLTRQVPDGLQLVVWSLREGALYRWESPPLLTTAAVEDQRQRSQQQLAQRNQALKAIDGVASWQFYCYWGNAWSNCLSSGNTGPGTGGAPVPPAPAASGPSGPVNTRQLPAGVRMLVQFAPGSGFNGPLTRQIEIAAL
jgi:general secretion pathway protein J